MRRDHRRWELCEFTSCAGCTDATACNYDMDATLDDGPVISAASAARSMACNYDMNATIDSGDCTYPAFDYVDCDGNCINDEDGDGLCDEEEDAETLWPATTTRQLRSQTPITV